MRRTLFESLTRRPLTEAPPGITTSLPRMAHCSACDTVRLFRAADGYPIIAKLAAVDEEERQEQRERKLADERMAWAEMFERRATPA